VLVEEKIIISIFLRNIWLEISKSQMLCGIAKAVHDIHRPNSKSYSR